MAHWQFGGIDVIGRRALGALAQAPVVHSTDHWSQLSRRRGRRCLPRMDARPERLRVAQRPTDTRALGAL